MKSVKISDEAYDKLQEDAKRNYRTITGEVDWMADVLFSAPTIDVAGVPVIDESSSSTNEAVGKFYEVKNHVYDIRRRMAWLTSEIQGADMELKDGLAYDQDEDSQIQRKKAHQVYTQPLWDEYNALKAEIDELTASVELKEEG